MLRVVVVGLLLLVGQVSSAFAVMDDVYEALRDRQYPKAFELLLPLAEKGYGEAQYELAKLYLEGWGTDQDEIAGVLWLRRAADRVWLPARQDMADRAISRGDYAEAVTWLQKSAEKSYAPSEYTLGMMYLNGTGVRRDREEALRLIKASASQKYFKAEYQIGLMHFDGIGVEKSDRIAAWYFKYAAERAIKMLEER